MFLAGVPLAPDAVNFVSATQVEVTLPGATPSGPTQVSLRANKVAGPAVEVTVA